MVNGNVDDVLFMPAASEAAVARSFIVAGAILRGGPLQFGGVRAPF